MHYKLIFIFLARYTKILKIKVYFCNTNNNNNYIHVKISCRKSMNATFFFTACLQTSLFREKKHCFVI